MVPTRVRSVSRKDFTPVLIASLHALANRLLREDEDHFRRHAETNDVVHVFERKDTGEVVGFQFWRTAAMPLPYTRALLGGKLRVDPAFRNRALHLRSGLRFFLESKWRHPRTRFYRLSLASMFGYVSLTSALADYHIFDISSREVENLAVRETLEKLAAESHFRLDPVTGLFAVGIHMTEETLASYPESYYRRPQAVEYAHVNPEWRHNACYVAFWFRFTWRNVFTLLRTIARKR
jgi:hypothetical protein